MRPIFIFDLDGTLALCDHRRPILDNIDNSNRWNDFYEGCDKDKPNLPILSILNTLNVFSEIRIWSARSISVYDKTINWLLKYIHIQSEVILFLKMRPLNDSTPDEILKRNWYESLSNDEKFRVVAIFDDRKKVVDMWRSIGITCLQVANGDF